MKRFGLWIGLAVCVAATASWAVLRVSAAPEPGHRMFHIGCMNHNHGPAWHANHGRAIGGGESRFRKPDVEDARRPQTEKPEGR